MAEEVRFFLRTALYSAVIAVVYWFASRAYEAFSLDYDWAGTTLLVFIVLACGVMSGGVLVFLRAARHGSGDGKAVAPRGLGARLNRLIGLTHVAPGRWERPLAGGPDLFPAASAWPIVSAVAATLILLGLVFGPWLIAPGAVLLVLGLGGWLRE